MINNKSLIPVNGLIQINTTNNKRTCNRKQKHRMTIAALPADRKEAIRKLRKEVLKNLPKGFKEVMGYGMMGYVVPHSIYPAGYHCTPSDPLPFAGFASQKNFISFYHMGIYSDPELLGWFVK